jgi:hypothetical protein
LTGAGPRLWPRRAVASAFALIVAAPVGAFGGAWTLPQGSGQLIETLYGWTGFGCCMADRAVLRAIAALQ